MHWLYLAIAICGEVTATSALKSAEGFTRLGPSLTVAGGYLVAFYFLSLTLKVIPLGISYAIWSAVGIVLVSAIAWLVHGQRLDTAAMIGMGFIIVGVVTIHVFSDTVVH